VTYHAGSSRGCLTFGMMAERQRRVGDNGCSMHPRSGDGRRHHDLQGPTARCRVEAEPLLSRNGARPTYTTSSHRLPSEVALAWDIHKLGMGDREPGAVRCLMSRAGAAWSRDRSRCT
jgi:hypothetical protein